MRSGWRQLEEDLYRSHAQNLPEKVYLPQRIFFNGGFIIGNDYVRMYVTLVDLSWVVVASVLVDSSWVVVASVLTGVDFIPLKFLRITE